MPENEVLAAALQLARPTFELFESAVAGPIAGYWGGLGLDAAKFSPLDHLITVDLSFLRSAIFASSGVMSVYGDAGTGEVMLRHGRREEFDLFSAGSIPLYAHVHRALPEPQSLERLLPEFWKGWLRRKAPDKLSGIPIAHPEIVEAFRSYEDIYFEESPIYQRARPPFGEIVAVIGGWARTWPEEEEGDRLGHQLVLTTFRDAEPWYEVYVDRTGAFEALARIT